MAADPTRLVQLTPEYIARLPVHESPVGPEHEHVPHARVSRFFTLAASNYSHVVVVRTKGNLLTTYVNGTKVDDAAVTGSLVPNTGFNFQIGTGYKLNVGRYFGGRVAGFRVYSRALSTNEVQQNFDAQKSRYEI
jgi:hypothetical protein